MITWFAAKQEQKQTFLITLFYRKQYLYKYYEKIKQWTQKKTKTIKRLSRALSKHFRYPQFSK